MPDDPFGKYGCLFCPPTVPYVSARAAVHSCCWSTIVGFVHAYHVKESQCGGDTFGIFGLALVPLIVGTGRIVLPPFSSIQCPILPNVFLAFQFAYLKVTYHVSVLVIQGLELATQC